MTVTRTTSADSTLDVGDHWLVGFTATDDDGNPAALADVALTVTSPAGVPTEPDLEEESDGCFTAQVPLTAAGRWLAVAQSDLGGVEAFTAQATVPALAAPDLDEVKGYLGATSTTDAEIQDALDAETEAQRKLCDVPADYPADLRQALKRRVARNLAARAVPVAQFSTFEGGATSTRVPQTDPEVVRLEAPYRRVVVA